MSWTTPVLVISAGHVNRASGNMCNVEAVHQSDRDLLRQVIHAHSQPAFNEIVQRYLGLVYGAARRQIADSLAEDVTQAVFLLLWQRSSRIKEHPTLAGWLVNATRLIALQANRTERRRIRRERTAAATRSLITEDIVNSSAQDLSPLLDAALGRLNETERAVIVLRYLQDKSLAEAAATVGISEAAAAKRASRGLGRLREEFKKRGATLQTSAIAPILLELGHRWSPPPALAEQVVRNTNLGSQAVGTSLLRSASTAINAKNVFAMAVAVVILLLGGWLALELFPSGQKATDSRAQAAPMPVINRIKVGIVISDRTADTKDENNALRGYEKQLRIVRDLRVPEIELYPVIEDDMAEADHLPKELKNYFPEHSPLRCTDAGALKELNVIVSSEIWITSDEMLQAVHSAVKGGVGLLNNNGLGIYNANNSSAIELAGLAEGQFGYTTPPVACKVIGGHPILGDIQNAINPRVRLMGPFGILPPDAVPLLQATDLSSLQSPDSKPIDDSKTIFYPIYTSKLGTGRIVGCQFAAWGPVPSQLQAAGRARFFTRCVKWLAGRPVE